MLLPIVFNLNIYKLNKNEIFNFGKKDSLIYLKYKNSYKIYKFNSKFKIDFIGFVKNKNDIQFLFILDNSKTNGCKIFFSTDYYDNCFHDSFTQYEMKFLAPERILSRD